MRLCRFQLHQTKKLTRRGEMHPNAEEAPFPVGRRNYVSALRRWRLEQCKFMPHVADANESIDTPQDGAADSDEDDLTEDEIVGLPSDYSTDDVQRFVLQEAAHYEMTQREDFCFHLLSTVRSHVLSHGSWLKMKITGGPQSMKNNTRSNSLATEAQRLAVLAAERYNYSYRKLKRLRQMLKHTPPKDSEKARLRSIQVPSDLATSSLLTTKNHGEFKTSSTWIWRILDPRPGEGSLPNAEQAREAGNEVNTTAACAEAAETGTANSKGDVAEHRETTTQHANKSSPPLPSEEWQEKGVYYLAAALTLGRWLIGRERPSSIIPSGTSEEVRARCPAKSAFRRLQTRRSRTLAVELQLGVHGDSSIDPLPREAGICLSTECNVCRVLQTVPYAV